MAGDMWRHVTPYAMHSVRRLLRLCGTGLDVSLLMLGIVACGGGESPANARPSARPSARPAAPMAGAMVRAMTVAPLSSLADKPGDVVEASVTADVPGPDGTVAIPMAARLDLRIVHLEQVGSGARATGRVELAVDSVRIADTVRALAGTVDPVPYLVRGRNIIVERATPVTIRLRSP